MDLQDGGAVRYENVYLQPGNAMGRRNHHHVYVIELSKDVLYESRFRKANPGYVTGMGEARNLGRLKSMGL